MTQLVKSCDAASRHMESHLVIKWVLMQDDGRLLGHHRISETEAAHAYLAPDRMQPEINMICRVIIQKTPE